jgi:hypothetical protein
MRKLSIKFRNFFFQNKHSYSKLVEYGPKNKEESKYVPFQDIKKMGYKRFLSIFNSNQSHPT